jgi:hypothetical protein
MTNSKLNVGDRVRLNQNYMRFRKGDEGFVTSVEKANLSGGPLIWVMFKDRLASCYDFRLDKIDKPKELDVSTATDQELANECRRRCDEKAVVFDELRHRGYSITSITTGCPVGCTAGDNISISKTETKTVTL